jgi:hypothetical protein
MLREISSIRQNSKRRKKRWFTDADMDLFIWLNQQALTHFQLSYNKRGQEHAITWDIETGFCHNSVDTGEQFLHFKYKMTPILVADGEFDAATVARDFLQASDNIEESLADFIYARLLEYPGRLAIRSIQGSASRDL